jgi:hypothetical protein
MALLDLFDAASTDFTNAFRPRTTTPTTHSVFAAALSTPPPSNDVALLSAKIDAVTTLVSSLATVAAFTPHDPRTSFSRSGRDRGPPPKHVPRPHPPPTQPPNSGPYSLVACTDPRCHKTHKLKHLACDCGAPGATVRACLTCSSNPLSIEVCRACRNTFTDSNSRPYHSVKDHTQLARLYHHATTKTMKNFFPLRDHPTFDRSLTAPPAVHALYAADPNAAAPSHAPIFPPGEVYSDEARAWLLENDECRRRTPGPI